MDIALDSLEFAMRCTAVDLMYRFFDAVPVGHMLTTEQKMTTLGRGFDECDLVVSEKDPAQHSPVLRLRAAIVEENCSPKSTVLVY